MAIRNETAVRLACDNYFDKNEERCDTEVLNNNVCDYMIMS